jgi:hypothetical protein
MDCSDVFENYVVDGLGDVGGVAHGSNHHGAGLIAGCVFDIDVLAVAFDRYTILQILNKHYKKGG